MINARNTRILMLAILASAPLASRAEEVEEQPDQLCQLLFDKYVAREGKINTSTVKAATHILAERGRDFGFWKVVLRELQKGDKRSEAGCLRLLGGMLAIDAAWRDLFRWEKETGHQAPSRSPGTAFLGPEVVKEVIARGSAAKDSRVDDYVVALMRARVPESTDFFRTVLRQQTQPLSLSSAGFHAAVGLAQLGEADGFEWLVKNIDAPSLIVRSKWLNPTWNRDREPPSVAVLRELTGEKDLKTILQWQSWWEKADKKRLPKGRVRMYEP